MGRKTKQKPMSHGTAPQRLIVMIESDTTCRYWHLVVGVTIPFKGPKRGLSKIMVYFTFDSCIRNTNQNPMSHGTAPLKSIVMIDSITYCKHWYIVVCITILLKGPKRGLSKIMKYFTFDYWVGKLNKNLYLVVLPHKGSLS